MAGELDPKIFTSTTTSTTLKNADGDFIEVPTRTVNNNDENYQVIAKFVSLLRSQETATTGLASTIDHQNPHRISRFYQGRCHKACCRNRRGDGSD